jgi:hypothetical protein
VRRFPEHGPLFAAVHGDRLGNAAALHGKYALAKIYGSFAVLVSWVNRHNA